MTFPEVWREVVNLNETLCQTPDLHGPRFNAPVAMLCQGSEVYGIGTIQRQYAAGFKNAHFICMGEGQLTDWLRDHEYSVTVLTGLKNFTAASSLGTVLRLPAAIQKARYDARQIHEIIGPLGVRVVHTFWLPQQLVAGFLKNQYGYKSVWQINNNTNRKRLFGLGLTLNQRLARWGADLLLPASDFIAENWRGSGVLMRTVRNSADPILAAPTQVAGGTIHCLIAGRLDASKGHHLAIDAILEARRQNLDVTLDIFGGPLDSNSYYDKLREMVCSAGADGAIRFRGFQKNLRELHPTYHLGLQCRIDPEPCSLWVCETLVDGLPLIASATGGTPELVADCVTGTLFRTNDVDDLTQKLIDLISDPDRLAKMRKEAFERGNTLFNTARFIRETMESYAMLEPQAH